MIDDPAGQVPVVKEILAETFDRSDSDFSQDGEQGRADRGFDERIERAQHGHSGAEEVRQLPVHESDVAAADPARFSLALLADCTGAAEDGDGEKIFVFQEAHDRAFAFGVESAGDFFPGLGAGNVLKFGHVKSETGLFRQRNAKSGSRRGNEADF